MSAVTESAGMKNRAGDRSESVELSVCASQIYMVNLTTNFLKWVATEWLGVRFKCLLIAESKGCEK